jgi:hypothetical protein
MARKAGRSSFNQILACSHVAAHFERMGIFRGPMDLVGRHLRVRRDMDVHAVGIPVHIGTYATGATPRFRRNPQRHMLVRPASCPDSAGSMADSASEGRGDVFATIDRLPPNGYSINLWSA